MSKKHTFIRSYFLQSAIYLGFLVIAGRLFYWQIIKGNELSSIASKQYERSSISQAKRGDIFTSDGYLLVGNQPAYRLFAQKDQLDQNPDYLAKILAPLILETDKHYQTATQSATRKTISQELETYLQSQLESENRNWVGLQSNLPIETKEKIEELQLKGLGFDEYEKRFYPEASLAAHVTGFVGKDDIGEDTGYFGLEGALNNELKPYTKKHTSLTDALGLKLLFKGSSEAVAIDGRNMTISINRDIQLLIEEELKWGIEHYGAKKGEVIVMDPKTGKILGMASFPNYDQARFYDYDTALYKNPSLSDLYEPGSTFKTLTIAAGIDSGVIEPDTKCDQCDGPKQIGKYTIKTWNDEYHPNIDMTEALSISDNTAMIFVAQRMGAEKFQDYMNKFGIGKEIGIDLQEDGNTPMEEKWGEVELATRSFGQGISINSMQLVRAIGAIANDGVMMQPQILDKVLDKKSNQEIIIDPEVVGQPISKEAARKTKQMLAYAAENSYGWLSKKRAYQVAGKSGTSQIPDDKGGYKADGTMASFIAFSPVDQPKFIMFVKLTEPSTSEWGAETAAPLWFKIADKLQLLL